MAKRFNQLTQLTAAQVAQNDIIPIRDESAGQVKYITVKDLTGSPDLGWSAAGEAWLFSSFSSTTNTGVLTVPTDATLKYTPGMFVRFSQSTGGTKYGRILAVTATTLTVWFGDGAYTLVNETLSSPNYSPLAHPVGIPLSISEAEPYKFSVYKSVGQSLASSGQQVTWDTEEYDTAGNFASNSFTAPVAGVYHFTSHIQLSNGGSSVALYYQLRKNGAAVNEVPNANINTNGGGQLSVQLKLAAGDTVGTWAFMSSGTFTSVGLKPYSHFAGIRTSS